MRASAIYEYHFNALAINNADKKHEIPKANNFHRSR